MHACLFIVSRRIGVARTHRSKYYTNFIFSAVINSAELTNLNIAVDQIPFLFYDEQLYSKKIFSYYSVV